MRRTTRPDGRSRATSSKRSSGIAGAPARGSSPTRSTSASISQPNQPVAPELRWTSPPKEDRLVVVHSFSKSFLMTGWRLGWMVVPCTMIDAVGKLIEFNTSCAPVFVQRGGLAALDWRRGLRAFAGATPAALPRHAAAVARRAAACPSRDRRPAACTRSFASKARTIRWRLPSGWSSKQGLGLAPGAAFGSEGEGWLRWCFASRDPSGCAWVSSV